MEQVKERVATKKKINFSEIKKWNVIFHNDNKTTMEFVIFVLIEIFKHSETNAEELTYKIHTEGTTIVGQYVYEIAQQKASETLNLAAMYGYPLNVTIEKCE